MAGRKFNLNPNFKHGHALTNRRSPEYRIWDAMKRRCCNPKATCYRHYGGRGIMICKRWMTFQNFLDDMGRRPKGKSIDRIDNNGDYCPENCRWASTKEQARNTSSTILWTMGGVTNCIADWAKVIGMSPSGLRLRVCEFGWSIEKALSTKPRPKSPNGFRKKRHR